MKVKDAFDKNIIYAVENEDTSFYIITENQMVAHIISSEPHKNRYYADLFARALRNGVREKCETCKYFDIHADRNYCTIGIYGMTGGDIKNGFGCNLWKKAGNDENM